MLFNLILLAALLYAIIMAPVMAVRAYRNYQRQTEVAVGKVTDVRLGKLRWGINVPRPEIEFQATNGRSIRFHSEVGASWNPWPKGRVVKVRYDPAEPGNAQIAFQKWHYYAAAIALGAAWLYLVSTVYRLVTHLLAAS